jgi:hypothetical protein
MTVMSKGIGKCVVDRCQAFRYSTYDTAGQKQVYEKPKQITMCASYTNLLCNYFSRKKNHTIYSNYFFILLQGFKGTIHEFTLVTTSQQMLRPLHTALVRGIQHHKYYTK